MGPVSYRDTSNGNILGYIGTQGSVLHFEEWTGDWEEHIRCFDVDFCDLSEYDEWRNVDFEEMIARLWQTYPDWSDEVKACIAYDSSKKGTNNNG